MQAIGQRAARLGRYVQIAAVLVVSLAILRLVAEGSAPAKKVAIDVACDANTFVFQGPSGPEGPAYGASFVVEGVIYPAGTFDQFGATSGLDADGDPEFPELVIGRWTCRGWFVGEGFATTSGPFVATTQIYDLQPDVPGLETLVSDGLELIDVNQPFARAVTGGTGAFRKARGEVLQTALGLNATGLFNFSFEFDL